eukprot:TRINITY_DN9304_c0_g1_i4.p1 TRINITY_DN9304_c0_g1~~TRINITY_DN9304_c0_g1_i4.p1  ORF type:complete len:180 (-),score=41.11 TRINITY_DN9304_c0_g1_i4:457-996(-)
MRSSKILFSPFEFQMLVIPFQMRGYQRVYNLEKKIFTSAVRGLRSVDSPLPVHFPLPDPSNMFSLKPGSLAPYLGSSLDDIQKPSSLDAAIAGARAAATQFLNKEKSQQFYSSQTGRLHFSQYGSDKQRGQECKDGESKSRQVITHESSQMSSAEPDQLEPRVASSRIFAEAVRSLRPK